MEGMRELLRGSLGRSLEAMQAEDKLAAAWTVACGKAMADHGTVATYEGEVVTIQVTDATWLRQMMSMRGQLTGELARIAGVKVREIHFVVKHQAGLEAKHQPKRDDRR
jgi:hypothetical protein